MPVLADSSTKLFSTRASTTDIKAVSYSSQANSNLFLDADDKPLTEIMLWTDQRATVDEKIKQLWLRDDFLATTGMGIEWSPGLTISKILWFQKNDPQLWSRVSKCMSISDLLISSLTGEFAADTGTFSLTGLVAISYDCWWNEAFSQLGLKKDMFPRLVRPGSIIAPVNKKGSQLTGLPEGIPLPAGSLDHYIAAVGAGVGSVTQCSESTGTVLACVCKADDPQPIDGGCVGPGMHEGEFYKLTFSTNGASVLEWYQKTFCPQLTVSQLVELAGQVDEKTGLVAKPNANTLENLQGFPNVTEAHSHGDFARAIMMSVTMTLDSLVDILSGGEKFKTIAATGGGAKSDLWLEMKAAQLGCEFIRPNCPEPACKGAAILAAVNLGWFDSLKQAGESWANIEKIFSASS